MVFLNYLSTSSSSKMLVKSEWSDSRATGLADLKISAGIRSIPGNFPEQACLIAFETSSIIRGRSRLVIIGFCGIWSSTVGSTVEGLLSRVLKCSKHLALMLLFSLTHFAPHQLQAVSLSNPMPRETTPYFLMGMQLKKRNIHAKQYGLYAF